MIHAARSQQAPPTAVSGRLSPILGAAERSYCFAIAMKYMRDLHDAEDVTQDALLLAHQRQRSFRGDARYSTWLYRVVSTTALMHLRKARRRKNHYDTVHNTQKALAPSPSVEQSSPETRLASAEHVDVLLGRLARLGEKYEEVFWPLFFEGCTEKEIATQLSVPRSTVKSRAHRLREALKRPL